MNARAEELRAQIRRSLRNILQRLFRRENLSQGESPVPVSGKVFDEAEMQHLVDSSLDFWLTTGRFADEFEKEFSRFIGSAQCHSCQFRLFCQPCGIILPDFASTWRQGT